MSHGVLEPSYIAVGICGGHDRTPSSGAVDAQGFARAIVNRLLELFGAQHLGDALSILGVLERNAEEFTPLVIQQRTAGLQGVFEDHSGSAVLLLELDSLAVEIHPHQGGLTAQPGAGHLAGAVRGDQLLEVGCERFFRHAEPAIRVKQFLIEEEAVRTGQVTGGATELDEEVEARRNRILGHMLGGNQRFL